MRGHVVPPPPPPKRSSLRPARSQLLTDVCVQKPEGATSFGLTLVAVGGRGGGLHISEVVKASVADKSGELSEGDVLLAVNGKPVNDEASAYALLEAACGPVMLKMAPAKIISTKDVPGLPRTSRSGIGGHSKAFADEKVGGSVGYDRTGTAAVRETRVTEEEAAPEVAAREAAAREAAAKEAAEVAVVKEVAAKKAAAKEAERIAREETARMEADQTARAAAEAEAAAVAEKAAAEQKVADTEKAAAAEKVRLEAEAKEHTVRQHTPPNVGASELAWRFQQRKTEEGAFAQESTADGAACDDYRIDVTAATFGTCKCGRPKADHRNVQGRRPSGGIAGRSPGGSTAPWTRKTPSPAPILMPAVSPAPTPASVTAPAPAPAPAPERALAPTPTSVPPILSVGDRVHMNGLIARADLNGRYGSVLAYDEATERFTVAVDGGGWRRVAVAKEGFPRS